MFFALMTTALAADAWDIEPQLTRAGTYRFLLGDERDQDLTDGLLERLATGGESSGVRMALVEAVPRSGGDWSALTTMFATEASAPVRETIVDVMRHADAQDAAVVIRSAIVDDDIDVRAAAARAAGWQLELGDELVPVLLTALQDGHPEVRAFAARSVGWIGLDGFSELQPLLSDVDATVRLNSLRAMERIDEARLRTLPQLDVLAGDVDAKVSRAAAGLQ